MALAAALAGLIAPAAARGQAPAAKIGPCAFVVTPEPARLEAGAPRAVRLRVTGPGGPTGGATAGDPVMTVPPRLRASEGRLEPVEADGDGWTAIWQAPEAGVPRVAVVAGLDENGACGWVAVPLDGVGDAEVRTRAGAVVEVRIAERTFGPARADASGLAIVPVEVPPGVDAVFHGARRIPLPLPPVAHAALFLAAEEAPADREVALTALLVAVAPDGAPHAGPAPAVAASHGVLGAAEPAGPGAWRRAWRLPPGPAGEVALTAQLPGEPAVRAALRRVAGPPATARLTLDPPRAVAGQAGPVTAAVALADAAGNPADAEVVAEVEAGRVEPAERVGPGDYRLQWFAPARLDGRERAGLTVRAGEATATASLPLSAAVPAHLSLEPSAPRIVADGAAEVDLVITVADAHGNPIDEPPARRAAGAGELGPPRPAGPGRFLMAYRPRAATAPAEDEVVVELPPLTARARPRLLPPLSPLAAAVSAGAALGPGAWLGLQAGAEVSAWRWLGGHQAGLSVGAAFTRLSQASTVPGGLGPVPFEGEVRTLALLASGTWRRAASERLSLRLAAGVGAARVESLVAAGGGPLLPEAGWGPAATGAAAAGLRLGRGRAFLEARWTWLADAGLASLSGSPSPLSLSLGYELDAP